MDGIRSGGVKREVKATLARIQKEYDAVKSKPPNVACFRVHISDSMSQPTD